MLNNFCIALFGIAFNQITTLIKQVENVEATYTDNISLIISLVSGDIQKATMSTIVNIWRYNHILIIILTIDSIALYFSSTTSITLFHNMCT